MFREAFRDSIRRYRRSVERMGFDWNLHIAVLGVLFVVVAICVAVEIAIGKWDDIKGSVIAGILILGGFWLFSMALGVVMKTAYSLIREGKLRHYQGIAWILFVGTIVGWVVVAFFIMPASMVTGNAWAFISMFLFAPVWALIITFASIPYDYDYMNAVRGARK